MKIDELEFVELSGTLGRYWRKATTPFALVYQSTNGHPDGAGLYIINGPDGRQYGGSGHALLDPIDAQAVLYHLMGLGK